MTPNNESIRVIAVTLVFIVSTLSCYLIHGLYGGAFAVRLSAWLFF